ncbi:MAG: glycosyltransferase family 4 protein [Flavobacteriales bacterium]|nr:glycosyltransferase family 4 protein [Flavobacteriales bacterium]NCQ11895.1 glycosyltransferase family 4 protein [Bacteroidota bacterium]
MLKKRLVISCYVTTSLKTGVGRYLVDCIEHELNKGNSELTLLISKKLWEELDVSLTSKVKRIDLGVTEQNRFLSRIHYYWKQWRFQNESKNCRDYDELWIPNTVPIFKGKLATKVTIHDLAEFDTKTYGFWNGLVRKLFVYSIVKNATLISVVSEFTKQRLLIHTGVNEDKIVIEKPLFSYLKRFKSSNKEIDFQPKTYFLYVGRFSKNKNITILLNVYELARKINVRLFPILLIGPNSKESELVKRELKTKHLLSDFHFKHSVNDDELANYYKHAKAFIYPSTYEGYGLPPQEALNMGTSLILARIPALIENYSGKGVFFKEDSEEELLTILLTHCKELN